MPIKNVDVATAKAWLDKNEAILIDVREQDEYRAAHIPAAILLPLSHFSPAQIPPSDKKILIHCRSGKRSYTAAEAVVAADATQDVYNVEGGILAWAAADYPVKQG